MQDIILPHPTSWAWIWCHGQLSLGLQQKFLKYPWFRNQDCPLNPKPGKCARHYTPPSNFMSINVMSCVILHNHIIIVQSENTCSCFATEPKKTNIYVLMQELNLKLAPSWYHCSFNVKILTKFNKNRKISQVYTRKRKSKNFSISLSINSKISPGKQHWLIQVQLFTTNLLQRTPFVTPFFYLTKTFTNIWSILQ